MTAPGTRRFLGITVMTPYIQYEGVERALDNIVRAGATAVACNTSVVAPGDERSGTWQPPDDAGASVRLFDRPLWGKRALWLRSGPGHHAGLSLFAGSSYQPRAPNDLTDAAGPIIEQFIVAARARGLKVYVQTGAVQPPGLREEDLPRLPDGRVPAGRMANTGSLASPAIRAYNQAWVRDLFARYPQLDGIRPDWPEYPCYKLDEAFQDFGDHVRDWAAQHGFDFERIRHDVLRFYQFLHGGLADRDLADLAGPARGAYTLVSMLVRYPGVAEWLRLKAALSVDLLAAWRTAIDQAAGPEKELSANAFMPPFNLLTGLDFAGAAGHCAQIAPKLYTMHWSLIVTFWAGQLLAANSGLSEPVLVRALVNLLDLADQPLSERIDAYGYPEPDAPHPIPDAAQQRKIMQVLAAVRGRARVTPIVHGYGPLDDFRRRLQVVADSPADGAWINRYGYLSDAKLDVIRQLWH